MKLTVNKSSLKGNIYVPSSKSHTLRAVIFATIAEGTSTIINPLDSPDAHACVNACRLFGAEITQEKDWIVKGTAGKLRVPDKIIDVGNSGITLRFIAGMAANCDGPVEITGDASICSNRPMDHMLTAFNQLGCEAHSKNDNGYAPLLIKGPIKGGKAEFVGQDSQPVSGLLIGSILCQNDTELKVINAGEKPWVDMTLRWLDKLGIKYENNNYDNYKMYGNQKINTFELAVPGDFSSAAFPIVAALITENSDITLKGLDMKDSQGDKEIVNVLKKMGADITVEEDSIRVKSSKLRGIEIDVNDFIDAVPILSVVGCFAEGTTVIKNAAIARKKESDRLSVMAKELGKMGANIEEKDDSLIIHNSSLKAAELESHHDHRVPLSLAVAAMAADGETIINGTECIAKTFGTFPELMRSIGAMIK